MPYKPLYLTSNPGDDSWTNDQVISQNKEVDTASPPDYAISFESGNEDDKGIANAIAQDKLAGNALNALSYLPGVYGFIEDFSTGEKIYMSLSPYEIAPRLGDLRMFTPDDKSKYIVNDSKGKFDSDGTKALKSALTVGNRLSASRVYTNYMQETLPAPNLDGSNGDIRFSSKANRIGNLTRFLSDDGDEADKSTFMHIVPDMDQLGGKIPITYKKYSKDKDGNPVEEPATAFVPVNFNFVSSKYSLTIKEFAITDVQEANREIYSVEKSFDGYTLRFFGQQPKIISFSGKLTNFDDDKIGVSDELSKLLKLNFNGETYGNSPSKGSQRDVFLSYYNNFLAGTKCKDYNMKLYFYYNHRIIEGYLIEMSMSSSSDNDNIVNFGGNIIVKREQTTFEAGRGLGTNIKPGLANNNLGTGALDEIYSSQRSFRLNYRNYALAQAKGLITKQLNHYTNNTDTSVATKTIDDQYLEDAAWMDNKLYFDKTPNSLSMQRLDDFSLNHVAQLLNNDSNLGDGGLESISSDVRNSCVQLVTTYILNSPHRPYKDFLQWFWFDRYKIIYNAKYTGPDGYLEFWETQLDYLSNNEGWQTNFPDDTSTISLLTPEKLQTTPVSVVFRAFHANYFNTFRY